MPKYICEHCKEVFHDKKRARECPKCHKRPVHLLPPPLQKAFFYECQYCMERFMTDLPAEKCPECWIPKKYLKKIDPESVVICDHCGAIMFCQGHLDSHWCKEKEEGVSVWIKTK